jgi:uncharacterized protein (TIGR04255 family)
MSDRAVGGATLPSFEQPPVAEVVIAVAFDPVDSISLDLGEIYRSVFQPAGFNRWEEKAPYFPPIESFGDPIRMPEVRFEVFGSTPSPRYWFLNTSGSELVQLQRNWFAQNWRRTPGEPIYPRYASIRGPFEQHLRSIDAYCLKQTGTPLRATQCEVTYVGELDRVTRLWGQPHGYLPTPEQAQFSVSYVMTQANRSAPIGRLHAAMAPSVDNDTGEQQLSLTLTARGEPEAGGVDSAMSLLDLGHEWIVNGFKAMATPAMLAAWKEQ